MTGKNINGKHSFIMGLRLHHVNEFLANSNRNYETKRLATYYIEVVVTSNLSKMIQPQSPRTSNTKNNYFYL